MTDNLFRPEVLQSRGTAWLGTTRLPSPRIAWPMALLSLALVACVAAFLVFGQHVRKVRVQGLLVPSRGWLAAVAPGAGTVTRVDVIDGETVQARQVLLEIAATGAGAVTAGNGADDRGRARQAEAPRDPVRAPGRGVVAGVAVQPGQPVARGQRLLSVMPAGSVLQAELWAPGEAIGELAPGTPVALRYGAFPFRRHGVQSGRVLSVSRSPLSPREIRRRNGMTVPAPAYRVLVALDAQIDRGAGRPLPLRAGMALDADLLLERRRLYDAVFFPIRPRGGT